MTAVPPPAFLRVAAEAALAVPGVAALQPRLSDHLAAAAAPARTDAAPGRTSPEAGIRAARSPDGPGWRVEVRCVLSGDRRALDVARNVHDRVRAAVASHLADGDTVRPVAVGVTVTRVATRHDVA